MQLLSQFDPIQTTRNIFEGAQHNDHLISNPHNFSGHDSFDDSLFPRLESIDQKDFALFGSPSNNQVTSSISTQDATFMAPPREKRIKVIVNNFGEGNLNSFEVNQEFGMRAGEAENDFAVIMKQAYCKLIMQQELDKYMFVLRRQNSNDEDVLFEFGERHIVEWLHQNIQRQSSSVTKLSQDSQQDLQKNVLRLELVKKSEFFLYQTKSQGKLCVQVNQSSSIVNELDRRLKSNLEQVKVKLAELQSLKEYTVHQQRKQQEIINSFFQAQRQRYQQLNYRKHYAAPQMNPYYRFSSVPPFVQRTFAPIDPPGFSDPFNIDNQYEQTLQPIYQPQMHGPPEYEYQPFISPFQPDNNLGQMELPPHSDSLSYLAKKQFDLYNNQQVLPMKKPFDVLGEDQPYKLKTCYSPQLSQPETAPILKSEQLKRDFSTFSKESPSSSADEKMKAQKTSQESTIDDDQTIKVEEDDSEDDSKQQETSVGNDQNSLEVKKVIQKRTAKYYKDQKLQNFQCYLKSEKAKAKGTLKVCKKGLLKKPIKDHQLIQCSKNVIIHTPTPHCFQKLFQTNLMLADKHFVNNIGQHLDNPKTYKIVLQPEQLGDDTFDQENNLVTNRFLPKDFFRDFLIRKVKQLAMHNGFKIKMPYADRVDKSHSTRTINFYCHMSKSANRKILTNSCPFRAIFKMKMGCLKQQRDAFQKQYQHSVKNEECSEVYETTEDIQGLVKFVDWQKVFELHKLFNLHNHEMINYSTLQTVNHPLTEFLTTTDSPSLIKHASSCGSEKSNNSSYMSLQLSQFNKKQYGIKNKIYAPKVDKFLDLKSEEK